MTAAHHARRAVEVLAGLIRSPSIYDGFDQNVDLVVSVVPTQFLRGVARQFEDALDGSVPIVSASWRMWRSRRPLRFFSATDNESISYTNTTGADQNLIIEVDMFTAAGCNDYLTMSFSGGLTAAEITAASTAIEATCSP